MTPAHAFTLPGRVRQTLALVEDAARETPREAFIRIHGEEPYAPLSVDRCDRLAKGNPEIRGALLRMFGG